MNRRNASPLRVYGSEISDFVIYGLTGSPFRRAISASDVAL